MKDNLVVPCRGCPNCLGEPSGHGVNATIPCLDGDGIQHVYMTQALLCKNNPSLTAQHQGSTELMAKSPSDS